MTGSWFTGWATGDVVTAAEFRKGAGSIFDVTLGANAGQIDVTSIPQTYAHLLITLYARCDIAAANTLGVLRFNADAGTTYDFESLAALATSPAAGESIGALTGIQICTIPGATAAANLFGATQVFIPHYAGSVNQKSFLSMSIAKWGTATANMRLELYGGGWRSTAAINRITLLAASANLVAGTRLTIHALGA